jgi:hypothetical protein
MGAWSHDDSEKFSDPQLTKFVADLKRTTERLEAVLRDLRGEHDDHDEPPSDEETTK